MPNNDLARCVCYMAQLNFKPYNALTTIKTIKGFPWRPKDWNSGIPAIQILSLQSEFRYFQCQIPGMILALKRQKPLTNALDGLYLTCADRILLVFWVKGRADTLRWHASMWGESWQGFSITHDGVGFHSTGSGVTLEVSTRGRQSSITNTCPLLSRSLTMGQFTCFFEYD